MATDQMNILDAAVIERILSETQKSDERDRRRNSFNAYQIYSGNLEPYVIEVLRTTRPKSYKGYTVSDISLSALITDKRAQAYNEEPIRNVDGNDEKTESLMEIYEEGAADEELDFFDTIYNLNRHSIMWVNYRDSDEEYQFMTLQPFQATLVRDKDTGELLIVGLNYPNRDITSDAKGENVGVGGSTGGGDGLSDLIVESQPDSSAESETWVFWSKDKHVTVRARFHRISSDDSKSQLKIDIDYVDNEDNPNNENPLGIIPFVFKSTDTSPDYPVTNPLTRQTIKFNSQQSETFTSKNIHGTGIQVFKYPEKYQGKFDKLTHGQLGAVELPQSSDPDDGETDFEYKTSGAQLIPMKDIDASYVEQVAKQHGLDNFELDNGSVNAMNGISRAIASSNVQKIINKNQKTYTKLEKEMFEIIKAWDRHNGTGMFAEDDKLQVVFPKPKVLVSDKETLDNIKLMTELGLIEEWEKLIKMDPNLSEVEAKEKLERINAERMANANAILGNGNGDNEERVDEES